MDQQKILTNTHHCIQRVNFEPWRGVHRLYHKLVLALLSHIVIKGLEHNYKTSEKSLINHKSVSLAAPVDNPWDKFKVAAHLILVLW